MHRFGPIPLLLVPVKDPPRPVVISTVHLRQVLHPWRQLECDGSDAMATREQSLARGTYFGERDVEKRVYDALVGDGNAHHREMELCRELAALAGSSR